MIFSPISTQRRKCLTNPVQRWDDNHLDCYSYRSINLHPIWVEKLRLRAYIKRIACLHNRGCVWMADCYFFTIKNVLSENPFSVYSHRTLWLPHPSFQTNTERNTIQIFANTSEICSPPTQADTHATDDFIGFNRGACKVKAPGSFHPYGCAKAPPAALFTHTKCCVGGWNRSICFTGRIEFSYIYGGVWYLFSFFFLKASPQRSARVRDMSNRIPE